MGAGSCRWPALVVGLESALEQVLFILRGGRDQDARHLFDEIDVADASPKLHGTGI